MCLNERIPGFRRIVYWCLPVFCLHWLAVSEILAEDVPLPQDSSYVLQVKLFTSIGQLVRRSQAIAHVTVTGIDWKEHDNDAVLKLRMGKIFLGNPPTQICLSKDEFVLPGDIPMPGDQGIMFMSELRTSAEIFFSDTTIVADCSAHPEGGLWHVVEMPRGFITGDNTRLDLLAKAIEEYIRWYRTKESTPIEYARFLAQIWTSPDERLREDSRFDLSYFKRSFAPADMDQLLSMDAFPSTLGANINEMRTRAQSMIRFRDQETVEAEFRQFGWLEKIKSVEDGHMHDAFRFLGRFSHAELREHQQIWAPTLRALVQGDDPERQWRAASMLSIVQDEDSIPVMLRRLHDPNVSYKRALLADLQRATGQKLPFDPDAPKAVRDAQILAWEEWWAGQCAGEK